MIGIGKAAVVAACIVIAVSARGDARSARAPATFVGWTVIPLRNGANEIDIDGDGRQDMVFLAWRDNADAHGYDLATFYRHTTATDLPWELVPFFNEKARTEDSLRTTWGADCQLRGIAIVRRTASPGEPITVAVGEREFGHSFADSASVTFVVYKVAHNADGSAGWPPVYFQAESTLVAHGRYCDVNDAFAEIGIRTRK